MENATKVSIVQRRAVAIIDTIVVYFQRNHHGSRLRIFVFTSIVNIVKIAVGRCGLVWMGIGSMHVYISSTFVLGRYCMIRV